MRRSLVVVASAILSTAAALAFAQSAHAGVLTSTTTVSASPSKIVVGDAVTLTSQVSVLGLSFGVTPTGTVTWTDGATTLATATISGCFVQPCTVTAVTTAIPAGSTTVVATYSGDALAASSTASVGVTATAPVDSTSASCQANNSCTTPRAVQDGNISGTLTVDNSDTNYTITLNASNGKLSCQGYTDTPSGVVLTFSSTATGSGATKELTYTGKGTAATAMHNAHALHPAYLGCYASPNPFTGYNVLTHSTGAAPFIASDGLYEAPLPACQGSGPSNYARPCITAREYTYCTVKYTEYTVYAPATDPKFSGP